jgi:hypothetical protein
LKCDDFGFLRVSPWGASCWHMRRKTLSVEETINLPT